jgi:hypothetical protein
MNMLLAEIIRELALENLRANGGNPGDEHQLGNAVVTALGQAGVDLRHGPTLEEMKMLLAEVALQARREARAEEAAV